MTWHGLLPVETALTIMVTIRLLATGPTLQQQKAHDDGRFTVLYSSP